MTTFIIGDVHGMTLELKQLLNKLSPQQDDQIIFVGDLLDKGEDSAGTVRLIREMSESAPFDVIVVEGNHEDKHKRYRRNLSVRPSVAIQQALRTPELSTITQELRNEDIIFLNEAIPFYKISEHNILVIHGGIVGTMKQFPVSIQAVRNLSGKNKKYFQLTMRTRYITPEGKFVPLGAETNKDVFWATAYDGRFGHVVFGHQPFLNGVGLFPHATGIDTGAVFGGKLTAMVIEDSGIRRFISVNSRKFAEPMMC